VEGSDSDSDKLSCCCCWCSFIIMAIGMAADGLRLGLNEAVGLGDADGDIGIGGFDEMLEEDVPSEVHGD
jgi:hypothetical protein